MNHKYLKIFFAVAGMQLYLLIVSAALSSASLFYSERGVIAALVAVIIMLYVLRALLIVYKISNPLFAIFLSLMLGAIPFIFFLFLGIGLGKPAGVSIANRNVLYDFLSGLALLGCFLSYPASFTLIAMLYGRRQNQ
jgi:hypothetical protein